MFVAVTEPKGQSLLVLFSCWATVERYECHAHVFGATIAGIVGTRV